MARLPAAAATGRAVSAASAAHGLAPTALAAQTLKQLVERGLVDKRKLPPPAGATVYELTPLGYELEPVVLALGRFGARYMQEVRADDATSERWAMVSLMRRFRGMSSGLRVTWWVADSPYALEATPERLVVRDGELTDAALRLRSGRPGFFGLISGRASLEQLLEAGLLEIERGSKRDAQRLVRACVG